ncbi:MAG: uroporphyrinogen decarboxylase family protein [Brevefilum sp.]
MTIQNGKQRINAFLNHQLVDRIPWVPLAGVHFGKLINCSARSVLTDTNKLFESLIAANQEYHPDGLPVYFDIQVEAEILGCDLAWSEYAPPSVKNHPLQNHHNLPEKLPSKEDGRLPIILESMKKVKSQIGETTALFGLVTGPLTIAYHLRGNALFFDLVDDQKYLKKLLNFTFCVTERIAALYREAGMDVIGIIEPVASQISPHTFKECLLKHFQTLFKGIHISGAHSMLHICGNATQIIELMCQTGANILSLDEMVNLSEIQTFTDQYGVFLQGNIPVTSHLLNGAPEDVSIYVSNLLKRLPNPKHIILSPGCDLPWHTPVKNVKAAIDIIKSRS